MEGNSNPNPPPTGGIQNALFIKAFNFLFEKAVEFLNGLMMNFAMTKTTMQDAILMMEHVALIKVNFELFQKFFYGFLSSFHRSILL